jgi:hypothetical protein
MEYNELKTDEMINKFNKEMTDIYSFTYFINNHYDWFEDRDPVVCYGEYKDKLDKKLNKINYSGYCFITISPDYNNRNIEYCDENIEKLKSFCKAQFNETNYSYYNYVIESGKHINKPHLHIHSFCRIKNPKHHKRDLMCMWNKFFPALVGDDYHVVKCNTKQMFEDKQNYLKNDRKNSHMNFEDLAETHGALGSSGSITAKK